MKISGSRTVFAPVFKALAVAAIILSLKPRVDLFFYGRVEHKYSYVDSYWNYFIMRSWLIAFAGVAVGLVLFWISGCFESKNAAAQKKTGSALLAIKRIAVIIGVAAGAVLACVYLPPLSALFGKNALDYHEPIEVPRNPGAVFMVMSNELAAPHIRYCPPDIATNFESKSNSSFALPVN